MINTPGRVCVFVIVLSDFLFSSLSADINYYIYPKSHYPSFGNGGTIGLIQMPTARMLPAGSLAFNWSDVDPYQRGSIIGQPFDWFEASYQYTDVNNALYSLTPEFSGNQSYKDKGFDIKLRLLKETALLPAIAVGMRDLAGTNVFSAEYFVASKRFNNIDISLGMGWGTYANHGIKNPIRYLGDHYAVEDDDVSVSCIREAVSRHLVDLNRSDLDGVLKRSVFAEGDELLKDHVTVTGNEVSLLPPVAGG